MRWLSLRALTALFVLAPVPGAEAQSPTSGSALPLEVVDSTYAVRLELERVAETIRHGKADPRRVPQPETQLVLHGLRDVAVARKMKLPHPNLGPLWDFGFHAIKLEAVAADRIVVAARAMMATDPDGAADVTLEFIRQADGRWRLRDEKGLQQFLKQQTQRLSRGGSQ